MSDLEVRLAGRAAKLPLPSDAWTGELTLRIVRGRLSGDAHRLTSEMVVCGACGRRELLTVGVREGRRAETR